MRVVVYVLATEASAVGVLACSLVWAPAVTGADLARLGVILVVGVAHLWLSRYREQSLRAAGRRDGVYVDTTGIWFVAAALVLPLPLAWVVVTVWRWQRWFVARRPVYRYLHSVAVTVHACAAAHVLAEQLLQDHQLVPDTTWATSLPLVAALSAAATAYWLVQAGLVGAAIWLLNPRARARELFGSRADNALDLLSIGLGVATALLALTAPAAVPAMLAVAVVSHQRAALHRLQAQAVTDPLTGLANRRAYDRALTTLDTPLDYQVALADERDQAAADRRDLCVVLVDLDRFKDINDTFGHPAGDDILRAIADVLLTHTHPDDTVARIGGDEFAVLIPQASLGTAQAMGESIRAAVNHLVVPTTDRRGEPILLADVTVSVGVSVRTTRRHQARRVVRAADRALYLSKAGGRNHSTFTEDLP